MRILIILFLLNGTLANANIDNTNEFTKALYSNLFTTSKLLQSKAQKDCRASALKHEFNVNFDAWIAASIIQFGPIQKLGGSAIFSFWPDKKGFTSKKIKQLIKTQDISIYDSKKFKEVSVAGKGFMALERLIYDDNHNSYKKNSYKCYLVKAIINDITINAQELNNDWQGTFDKELSAAKVNAGKQFLNQSEVAAAYLTSVLSGLEFIVRYRIGRPLGKFDKTRPKRAEAWRSSRSLRNIQISLRTLSEISIKLSDESLWDTKEKFAAAIRFSETLTNENFQNIDEISLRFQLQTLSTLVSVTHKATSIELSQYLGVVSGFNALDGD